MSETNASRSLWRREMNGRDVLRELRKLCRAIDDGLVPSVRRLGHLAAPIVLPAAIGLVAAGPVACDDGDEGEVCDDGVDNDGDEAVDCGDEDCRGEPYCMMRYMASFPEVCDDGADNDLDDMIDCDDTDCVDDAACL